MLRTAHSRPTAALLTALVFLLCGCNQSMTIRVEKLDVKPDQSNDMQRIKRHKIYLTGTLMDSVLRANQAANKTFALSWYDEIFYDQYLDKTDRSEPTEELTEKTNEAELDEGVNQNAGEVKSFANKIKEYYLPGSEDDTFIEQFTIRYKDYLDASSEIRALDDWGFELLEQIGDVGFDITDASTFENQSHLIELITESHIYLDRIEAYTQDKASLANLKRSQRALLATFRELSANVAGQEKSIENAETLKNKERLIDAVIRDLESAQNAIDNIDTFKVEITKIKDATSRSGLVSLGFGGFSNSAVHRISPEDPAYHYVLNAKPLKNAITEVRTRVSGDSTIMFVQESPTQMRVFSVDADGTQLVQNIMLITDKALQAAVNYLSPLPVGNDE